MLTGKPPFQSESLLETLTQVLQVEPPAPSEMAADIDVDLEVICLKCLEKKPEQRFKSVRAFRDELQRFVDGQPILSRRMTAWQRIQRWRQMVKRNPDVRIQSRTRWLGMPLVSIAFGHDSEKGETIGRAKGIVAIGDRAFGLIAVGGHSYGLVAYGMHARGVIALGTTSLGVLSSGLVSGGILAFGGIAVGVFAFGFLAVGYATIGFVSIAKLAAGAFTWKLGG